MGPATKTEMSYCDMQRAKIMEENRILQESIR